MVQLSACALPVAPEIILNTRTAVNVGKRLNGRELIMRKREKTKRCIYSDSCFKCPLSDCRMNTPAQLNCLPLDFEPDTKNFKVVKAHG